MKAALYARVSTADQDCGAQLTELRTWCQRFEYEIVTEYVDAGVSGAKAKRPALDQLMHDARERRFHVVLVYKLDRFGRSMVQLIANIGALTGLKIRFIAISQGIDTDQSTPTGNLMLNLLSAFAEFEREMISERVRSGIANARAKGKHLGRPRLVFRRDVAHEMRACGTTFAKIAQELGTSARTVRRELQRTDAHLAGAVPRLWET